MGYFHTSHPRNGKNHKRHVCCFCGRHREERFMEIFNNWHQHQWKCAPQYLRGCRGFETFRDRFTLAFKRLEDTKKYDKKIKKKN